MKYIPNAIKFANHRKSSSLIINIFEIVDLDLKFKTQGKFGLKMAMAQFL